MKKIHINNDDNYATPPEFYADLDKRFHFDFDPCPYNEWEIINDWLLIEWGQSNFVNPPYSLSLWKKHLLRNESKNRRNEKYVFFLYLYRLRLVFFMNIYNQTQKKFYS